MPRIFLALLLASALPNAVFGDAYLSSNCDGTEISIHLWVTNNSEEWEGYPVIVKQRQVGVCDSEVIVASPPFFLGPMGVETDIGFSIVAPLPDQYYTHSTFAVLPDGTQQQLFRGGHATGCGDAVAARGFLVQWSEGITLAPCPDGCWDLVVPPGAVIDFGQVSPDQFLPYVGADVAVDLYGEVGGSVPMPGDPALHVTRIVPVPGGLCEPVSLETETWGSLKTQYR